MLRRLFGPKHTFKDSLIILEEGLRSGAITLESAADSYRIPIVVRTRFQHSARVRVFAPTVSYSNVRWKGRATASSTS